MQSECIRPFLPRKSAASRPNQKNDFNDIILNGKHFTLHRDGKALQPSHW